MSIESAQACFSRLQTDEAFAEQLKNAASFEERQQIVYDAGYDYSIEEFNEVLKQNNVEAGNLELSEEELSAVVGGEKNDMRKLANISGAIYGAPINWRPIQLNQPKKPKKK